MNNKKEITVEVDEFLVNENALNAVVNALGYSKEQFVAELRKAQKHQGLKYITFEADDTEYNIHENND
ncbi:hypothetical protein Xbed_03547 [Xenorhabdus beddingii]|uniref:Uncharacterized protein n=1 Tax=Xenorhabdus beddingii TaxID=40578 RepID=A0A1Y2SDK2_9GAMM|nr:hypothetical protein [Xenorhabdus beddingii]OTA15897.1 hypothetical protein Xbed_03547 [Xenorhabdus beddingii]